MTAWAGLPEPTGAMGLGLIAHRIDPEAGGDNTSAGMRSIESAPVVGVEMDVLVTDGRLVVAHDRASTAGVPEPLEDVLAAGGLPVMLDLKEASAGAGVASCEWAGEDRFLHVGDHGAIQSLCRRARGVHVGLTWESPEYPGDLLDRLGAEVLNLGWWCVRPELVAAAHSDGRAVTVWTVDHPELARQLAGLGVDALVTNRPRHLAGALAVPSASKEVVS